MKAHWNGVLIAESDHTVVVEGNHYFPPASVRSDLLVPTQTRTTCPWKGVAHYYSIVTPQGSNVDAAWYYPQPLTAAAQIRDHVAFWRGVTVGP